MIRARRPGIALPMALLVLVALGLLSALALTDALHTARLATLAEDEARARAALLGAVAELGHPPDLGWLCLQPPMQPAFRTLQVPDGGRVEIRWWMVAREAVRAEVTAVGRHGARQRRIVWLRPDSLQPEDRRPGCPDAQRLVPAGPNWLGSHPEG